MTMKYGNCSSVTEGRMINILEEVKSALPDNTKRAAGLATEKGASSWLTVIPLKDMNFTLNKREFRYCLISYRAGIWHCRILADFFLKSKFQDRLALVLC